MSFGFGSFLASAEPPAADTLGTLVLNQTPAEIFQVYSEDIGSDATTARIVISNLVGQKLIYDGSAKQLISNDASANVRVYVASNATNPVVTTGDSANVGYTFTSSAPTGDNGKLESTNVYVRASSANSGLTSSNVSDGASAGAGKVATGWVQLVANGVVNTNVLTSLTAIDKGTYNFYYYVDSDLFDATGKEINPTL